MYYSILVSQVDKIGKEENEEIKKYIKSFSKVLIIPWAFAKEMTNEEFEKNYFNIKGERYRRYVDFLSKFGIEKQNITYANCYKETKEEIIDKINNSDVLLLPGGNPDMFFNKVVYDKEILYSIKNYKGDIIGESAGAVLHFRKYFLTIENSYKNCLEYYNGFGIIDDDFVADVHTINTENYINRLKNIGNEMEKNIYAITDSEAIIYNRKNKKIEYNCAINLPKTTDI